MTLTLLEHYAKATAHGEIRDASSQREVLLVLDRLNAHLLLEKNRRFWQKSHPILGVYMHGSVGVGKTYLMDLFYHHCTDSRKLRLHFHHFMQFIDEKLRQLQGVKDPLTRMVQDFSKLYRVICLDEFLLHDVADAMILTQLLQGLIQRGVSFVITANTALDELYLHGVQRERFLPVIECLKKVCVVMALQAPADYRLGRAPALKAYVSPLGAHADQRLLDYLIARGEPMEQAGEIMVQQRGIPFVRCSDTAIWFEFAVLCSMPRSRLDYLEIAQRFHTVLLSNVPLLAGDDPRVILLIRLIDVMYDQRVRLIISAAGAAHELYPVDGPLAHEFKRTRSRLEEMQSVDYP